MEFSLNIVLGLVAVAVGTTVVALILSRQADQMKLLAIPGDHRRHQSATPMVGGLAIYVGILLGFFLVDRSYANLLPSLLLLTAVGAMDDRYSLPSWTRFLVQGIATYLMIKLTGVQLTSLGYLTPNSETLLGSWSVPMTIFATIGVINAVNMSDGHDGLAGSLVVLVLAGLIFSGANPSLNIVVIAAVLGFLVLNVRVFRSHAKVFMGDAGSTALGLVLAFLLIRASHNQGGIWPVTALWLMALPLIDAVAVLLVRPLRGRSPFSADRIHYHHQLVDRGIGVNSAVFIAVLLQLGFIVLGIWAWKIRIAEHLQLVAFLIVFLLYVITLLWFTRARREPIS